MANLIGRRVVFRFADELVVNRSRGVVFNTYIGNFRKFLLRTGHVRRKILIFHEESTRLLNAIREAIRNAWGPFREERFVVDTHRRVGPRGGNTYVIFIVE